jgi:hypothetical protein
MAKHTLTQTKIKTTTYKYGDYLVDIVEINGMYDTYLYQQDNSFKLYMYGIPADKPISELSPAYTSLFELIEGNMEDQIAIYKTMCNS